MLAYSYACVHLLAHKHILVTKDRAPFGQRQESLGKSAIHGPPVTLHTPRVKTKKSDWRKVRNKISAHVQRIGPGQRLRFLVPTKRIL